eukprot:TRINITY_DN11134_c0_g1_i2.p2 TRINITY_DN11134_c0_g1~~TRINITY_DN11134_c0_g1_i2.p2  ORF type:complete len:302 (+),score=14.49 TRINITY_DN11134_c0_g1_i2:76-981(+)
MASLRMPWFYTIVWAFFFFNDTATTEIYTLHIVGSVRCVQETGRGIPRVARGAIPQRESAQHRSLGEPDASNGAVSVGRASGWAAFDHSRLRAADAFERHRLGRRHPVGHQTVQSAPAIGVNPIGHPDPAARPGGVKGVLNAAGCGLPGRVGGRGIGAGNRHMVEHDPHSHRGADPFRMAFIAGPEHDQIIARLHPSVRRVRAVGQDCSIPEIPVACGGKSSDSSGQPQSLPGRCDSAGGLDRDIQRPGDRPGPILVAADGRGVLPGLAVNVELDCRAGCARPPAGGSVAQVEIASVVPQN